jgi:hypothetical protein
MNWIATPKHRPNIADRPITTLFVNHWTHANAARRAEIDECLQRNLKNPHIDRVVLAAQSAPEHRRQVSSGKVVWVDLPADVDRPAYGHFFQLVNHFTTTPYDLNIIANSDVFFDETLALLKPLDLEGVCVALSRWEMDGGRVTEPAGDNSQDCWIFKGRVRPLGRVDWQLGKYSCDWRIAWELVHGDYHIINPTRDVKHYHLHASGVRNNFPAVPGPYHDHVPHCRLSDCHLPAERPIRTGVIAFSLYGAEKRYVVGAVRNCEMAKHIYPGWTLRFYVDDTVPAAVIGQLYEAEAELVRVARGHEHTGMLWRLAVADEPGYARWMVRDADSRLTYRERRAVDAWIDSGAPFHVMRDHPHHRRPIMGCAYGGVRGGIANMAGKIAAWQAATRNAAYACDEAFLEAEVWPLVKDAALVHDTFGSHDGQVRPFPTAAEFGHFVGARVYEDNHGGHDDRLRFCRDYLALAPFNVEMP